MTKTLTFSPGIGAIDTVVSCGKVSWYVGTHKIKAAPLLQRTSQIDQDIIFKDAKCYIYF